MKNIFRLAAVLGFMLLGSSCSEDYLILDNPNKLSESSFYKTEADFEAALVACYTIIGTSELYGNHYHSLMYCCDDRMQNENASRSALQYTSTDGYIEEVFSAVYNGINKCNIIIAEDTDSPGLLTDQVPFITESNRGRIRGETYFLRGLYYFYAAYHFEVSPLITKKIIDPAESFGNATKQQLMSQAESDLKIAISLLPESIDLGRANSWIAKAYLAKVLLYQNRFGDAEIAFKEIIDNGPYSLNMPNGTDSIDYVNAYLANFTAHPMPGSVVDYASEWNSESIYEIPYGAYTRGVNPHLPMRFSAGSDITWFNGYANLTGGFSNITPKNLFEKEFETVAHTSGLTKDPRYYATFINVGDSLDYRDDVQAFYRRSLDRDGNTAAFSQADINSSLGQTVGMRKILYPFHNTYHEPQAPSHDPKNWRLYRYSDMLLMYAEATLRGAGNVGDGLIKLNEVRARVGMPAKTILTKDAIIHERDVELGFEHIRFWDLARWYADPANRWIELSYIQALIPTYRDKHVCFPIPLSEIDKHSGKLQQNPKWQ